MKLSVYLLTDADNISAITPSVMPVKRKFVSLITDVSALNVTLRGIKRRLIDGRVCIVRIVGQESMEERTI
jgi:hypothetical protein